MKDRLINLVALHTGYDPMDIDMQSNFRDDLGTDSLGVVELVMELEDEFGVDIPDEYAEMMLTVGDVYNYLDNNVDDTVIR